jgi:hypothetical protein
VWPTNFWPMGIHPHYNVERYAYILTPGLSVLLGIAFTNLLDIFKNKLVIKNILVIVLLFPILLVTTQVYLKVL